MSTILMIVSSVVLSALAQILLKRGMSDQTILTDIDAGLSASTFGSIMMSPWVVGGLALYASGAFVWLFVLARAEVSYAYPFVGLGFILTMIFAYIVLGESIGPIRLLGTCLVAVGIVLIART